MRRVTFRLMTPAVCMYRACVYMHVCVKFECCTHDLSHASREAFRISKMDHANILRSRDAVHTKSEW